MVPLLLFGYAAAAIGFYSHIYRTAPIMEEAEATGCRIYELFPAEGIRPEETEHEEIRKAA